MPASATFDRPMGKPKATFGTGLSSDRMACVTGAVLGAEYPLLHDRPPSLTTHVFDNQCLPSSAKGAAPRPRLSGDRDLYPGGGGGSEAKKGLCT